MKRSRKPESSSHDAANIDEMLSMPTLDHLKSHKPNVKRIDEPEMSSARLAEEPHNTPSDKSMLDPVRNKGSLDKRPPKLRTNTRINLDQSHQETQLIQPTAVGDKSEQVIARGDKVHIITRRGFETDIRRHFLGVVRAVQNPLIRVNGYVYVFEGALNEFVKRPNPRTRVFALSDATNIVSILPSDTNMEQIKYDVHHGRLVLTDDDELCLEINEFGSRA